VLGMKTETEEVKNINFQGIVSKTLTTTTHFILHQTHDNRYMYYYSGSIINNSTASVTMEMTQNEYGNGASRITVLPNSIITLKFMPIYSLQLMQTGSISVLFTEYAVYSGSNLDITPEIKYIQV